MSVRRLRLRRIGVLVVTAIVAALLVYANPDMWQTVQPVVSPAPSPSTTTIPQGDAAETLARLETKGRAAKTGYARTQFGDGWARVQGCDMRNIILNRDLETVVVGEDCKVLSGVLDDPYTGAKLAFVRGPSTSDDVQIDHVVALSNAWQTGAQQLSFDQRVALANDPLELLAVEGAANQQKSDGDAATWLPAHKAFRCRYVARQISIKSKYSLWVTPPERDAMVRVLQTCPGQPLPAE